MFQHVGWVSLCFQSLITSLSRDLAALKFSTAHAALQTQGVGMPASASSRRLWNAKLTGSSVHLSSLLWSMPLTQFSFSLLHFSPHLQVHMGLQFLTCPFSPQCPQEPDNPAGQALAAFLHGSLTAAYQQNQRNMRCSESKTILCREGITLEAGGSPSSRGVWALTNSKLTLSKQKCKLFPFKSKYVTVYQLEETQAGLGLSVDKQHWFHKLNEFKPHELQSTFIFESFDSEAWIVKK